MPDMAELAVLLRVAVSVPMANRVRTPNNHRESKGEG